MSHLVNRNFLLGHKKAITLPEAMPKRLARQPETEATAAIAKARATFSHRLSALIPAGGVDAAASWLGVDRSTLYRWRTRGNREPGLFHTAALASYLNVTLADLLGEAPPEHTSIRPESRRVLEAIEEPAKYSFEDILRLLSDAVAAARNDSPTGIRAPGRGRDEAVSADANDAGSSTWRVGQ
jgi:hypothetical protein